MLIKTPASEPIRAIAPPADMERRALWQGILARLRSELSAAQYADWLRPARLYELAEGCYVVLCPNTFAAEHVRDTYGSRIRVALVAATTDTSVILDFAKAAAA